jgi:hypothetical protein
VAAGTYDSVTLTFANPEMTNLNSSGAAIGSCANGAKCELQPAINPATVTYTGVPFPLTITANQPTGLLLDFNLNNSIQADLSVTPAVSFTQMAPPQHTGGSEDGQMEEIDDIVGQITVLDTTNNTVTLQDSSSGQSFIAKVDSNTEIEGFDHIGLANAFASFKTGQIVEVSLRLMSDGSFTAHKVELKVQEGMNQNQLDGAVVAIDSPTEFKMVMQDEALDEGGVQVGNILTVTLQSGATFLIDTDGLSLPSTVSFQSSADLLVGQNVQIRIPTSTTGTSVTTDQVTLHRSQVTATVLSTNGANFTVSNLNSLFTTATPPITQIDVQTSSQTMFEGVTNATALAAGDQVSMRGLLFMTTGNPLLVADTVDKRPPGE